MTAISTLLTASAIAAASDSFLTDTTTGQVVETRQPKIVCIKQLRMAVSYWGLARANNFDTFQFLKSFATKHKRAASPERFALDLGAEATKNVTALNLPSPSNGLGFHIAVFENVCGTYVPELFLCTNYMDPGYATTNPTFSVSRESFKDTQYPNRSDPAARLAYYLRLTNHVVSRFNNGDPELFNPVADALMQMSMVLSQRGHFSTAKKTEAYRQWVREPIQAIADLQKRICKKGKRLVGGAVYDVIIEQSGQFHLSSKRIPVIH